MYGVQITGICIAKSQNLEVIFTFYFLLLGSRHFYPSPSQTKISPRFSSSLLRRGKLLILYHAMLFWKSIFSPAEREREENMFIVIWKRIQVQQIKPLNKGKTYWTTLIILLILSKLQLLEHAINVFNKGPKDKIFEVKSYKHFLSV